MFNAQRILLLAVLAVFTYYSAWARYKPKSWSVGDRNEYPASLTSEGVTIAAQPLYTDALAARVFDKADMVTRGIMPLAIVIFNENDFPIEVDGLSIELINGQDRIRTMYPNEVVYRLFKKNPSWTRQKVPQVSRSQLNADALDDFDQKFLLRKIIGPRNKGGGFLYLHIPDGKDMVTYLSNSLIYIPNVYRRDNGTRLIFFEFELKPAIR